MRKNLLIIMGTTSLALLITGCGGGTAGSAASASTTPLPSLLARVGENIPVGDNRCPNGGVEIPIGIDENGNGQLDEDEIDETKVVCHGKNGSDGIDGVNGKNALIKVSFENSGSNCPAGGQKIEIGLDDDGDGQLDSTEVDETRYVCHGIGGQNGDDGHNALVEVAPENAGPNCPAGGYKIQTGLDGNDNGQLDSTEIDETRYVCNGLGLAFTTTPIPSGSQCLYGGYQLSFGLDLDNDGTLSATEAQQSTLLCSPPLNAGWQGPRPLEFVHDDVAFSHLAVGTDGKAFAAWSRAIGRSLIEGIDYRAGLGWDAATKATVSDNNNGLTEGIVMDANVQPVSDGKPQAVMVWSEQDSSGNGLLRLSLYFNDQWNTRTTPLNATAADVRNPYAAMDGQGNVFVVWREDDTSGDGDIVVRRYDAGQDKWETSVRLEDDDATSAETPWLAAAGGRAVVVWQQPEQTASGSYFRIYASEYQPGSGWSPAQAISGTGKNAVLPTASLDASGNLVITWLEDANNDNLDFVPMAYYRPQGSDWADGTTDTLDNQADATFILPAMNRWQGGGRAVVVWSGITSTGTTQLWGSAYEPGQGWTSAQPLMSDANNDPTSFDVDMDGQGHAMVAWIQEYNDGNNFLIAQPWANRYVAGHGWTQPEPIGLNTGKAANIFVSSDGNGNSWVIWTEQEIAYTGTLWTNKWINP